MKIKWRREWFEMSQILIKYILVYTSVVVPVCTHYLTMNDNMLIGDNSVMLLN